MWRAESSGPKFRCGVFGIIAVGGRVSLGDVAVVEMPSQPWSPLPTVWRPSRLLRRGRDHKDVVVTPAFRQRSDPGAIDADDP